MARKLSPQSRALQDQICAVLADAWPETLTSAQIAERIGYKRTLWEVCATRYGYSCRAERADLGARHHDGPVPQDSWEIAWDAMAINPHLNRLARDGLLRKTKVQALRGVLWAWAGDREDDTLAEVEAIWQITP